MKTVFKIICILLFFGTTLSFSQLTLTTKLHGGYNSWVLGSAVLSSSENTSSIKIEGGGLAFGAGVFLGNPNGIQYGVGFAYLPMLQASVETKRASIELFPITAEILFNMGFFYTDLGLGLGFLRVSIIDEISTFKEAAPSPGFLGKVGLGFNFKLNDMFGVDLSMSSIIPFTDFGLSGGKSNIFINMIGFWQIGLFAGLSFSFQL